MNPAAAVLRLSNLRIELYQGRKVGCCVAEFEYLSAQRVNQLSHS